MKPKSTFTVTLHKSGHKAQNLQVHSLEEARQEFVEWRDANQLASSMLGKYAGQVRKGNVLYARISYNGRAWWLSGEEVKLTPPAPIGKLLTIPDAPQKESVPTSDFVASRHSLGAHVIDASRPYEDMKKRIVSLIALAIEGSEEYVANDLRHVVERVYQSEDVLWTLREQLPNCEWFECYERFYNAGLLIKVD